MTPSRDTCLFILDEFGILFSELQQSLYKLNSTATYVWCLLESGKSRMELINDFCKTFSTEREFATAQLEAIIKQWKDIGLIEDHPDEDKPSPLPRNTRSQVDEFKVNTPVFTKHKACEIHDYALLNSRIRICYASAEQAQWVHPVLAHLEVFSDIEADYTINISSQGEAVNIYCNGILTASVTDIQSLAPQIKGLITQSAVNNHVYFIFVHGGIVAKNGKCILMPGKSGSGKSTLTAALSQSGFQYMSDEIALLEESTFKIRPTPIAIGVKSTGWKTLENYYPQIEELVIHRREDGKLIRYIPPPFADFQASTQFSLPVGAVIFPRYRPNTPTVLAPYNHVDALQYILDDCLALPTRLTKVNVGEMVQWIKNTPCYELTMQNLEDAVTLIQQLDI